MRYTITQECLSKFQIRFKSWDWGFPETKQLRLLENFVKSHGYEIVLQHEERRAPPQNLYFAYLTHEAAVLIRLNLDDHFELREV